MRGRGFLVAAAVVAATLVLGASASATSTLPGRNGAFAVAAKPGLVTEGSRLYVTTLGARSGGYFVTREPRALSGAAVSPDGTLIAYATRSGPQPELWVVGATGRRTRYLGAGAAPTWSPDSSSVAYLDAEDGISIVPASGGTARRLVDVGGIPSWSPDGRTIAFFQNLDLVLVDIEDGSTRTVQDGGAPLAWAPDGRTIATSTGAGHTTSLVDVASGRARTVYGRGALSLVWAPDGSSVALVDYAGQLLVVGPGGDEHVLTSGLEHVLAWRADGTIAAQRIGGGAIGIPATGGSTRRIDPPVPDGQHAYQHLVAFPGGEQVVAVLEPKYSTDTEIVTYDPETRIRRQLTDDAVQQRHPIWSPDGRRLAYLERSAHTSILLLVVRRTRGNDRRVLARLPRDSQLAWSADGRWIAFVRPARTRQNTILWAVRADGTGTPRRLMYGGSSVVAYPRGAAFLTWTQSGRAFVVPVAGPRRRWALDVSSISIPPTLQLAPDLRRLAILSSDVSACGSYCDEPTVILAGPHGRGQAEIPGIAPFGRVLDLAWSPDSATLALATGGSTVPIVRPDGGSTELDLGVPGIVEVAWAPRPR
ncbi:MAG: hypothetical protein R3C15_08700 [Thermoleophilia bacterium]